MKEKISTPKVLMVGPGRNVMGGISTVVNSYYELGLDKKIGLRYISSMEDGSKIKKLAIAFSSYIEFSRHIKECDIVHVHMAAQASFTRKSIFIKKAKKAGKKIIIHQHSADFDDFYFKQCDAKKRKQIKKIFAMADIIIVLSEEWAKFFGENICDLEKIVILYNGVIIPKYCKKDYTDTNVLFLGRLGERKGSYDLLKAIPDILKVIPDAHFYLGGDGDIVKSQKLIDENGIQNHVKLLGWVRNEEKEIYLKKCSIFIRTSYHEGMPMALLEAMSYGLAAISTNAGGISRIIDNGCNGFRIEAGDIEAIKSKLKCLLCDPQLKKKLGINGYNTVKNGFNVEKNIKKLEQIYSELINKNGVTR